MRWVIHIDMDAFFASCEQLTRPTLRGRPVLVGGRERGVVAGASYEARAFGAHSAMPMGLALKKVGYRATMIYPRFAVYRAASARIMDIFKAEGGVIEQLSIDEAFMEPEAIQGASAQEVRAWAHRVRSHVYEETGLTASVGAGSGKQYAKIASGLAKPNGITVIPPDLEHRIVDPLPVRSLWGIGPVAGQKLAEIGVRTVGQFAAMPREDVELTLGKTIGPQLWMLAQGIDERPVAPRAIAKSIGSETTCRTDLMDRSQVVEVLGRQFDRAYRRLLADGRGARTVSVKVKTSSFEIFTRSATRPYASTDKAVLWEMAKELVLDPNEIGPIRLVGCSFSGLEQADLVLDLFESTDADFTTENIESAEDTEDTENDASGTGTGQASASDEARAEDPQHQWKVTQDVFHPEYGHGWIQGLGHGVISVRFETRTTGRGMAKTFTLPAPELKPADPIDSLEWEDWERISEFR